MLHSICHCPASIFWSLRSTSVFHQISAVIVNCVFCAFLSNVIPVVMCLEDLEEKFHLTLTEVSVCVSNPFHSSGDFLFHLIEVGAVPVTIFTV